MNSPVGVWQSAPWWDDGLGIDVSSYSNIDSSLVFSTDGFLFEASPSFQGATFKDVFLSGFAKTRELVVNYQNYYNACAPEQCEYLSTEKRSIVEVLSVLAGLIGGFNVAAKTLVQICCGRQVKKAKRKAKTENGMDQERNEIQMVQRQRVVSNPGLR